jgi:hypothetical protein
VNVFDGLDKMRLSQDEVGRFGFLDAYGFQFHRSSPRQAVDFEQSYDLYGTESTARAEVFDLLRTPDAINSRQRSVTGGSDGRECQDQE